MPPARSAAKSAGKRKPRNVAELNRATIALLSNTTLPVRTITAGNGTEFHGYKRIEERTNVPFYFATPHHTWERGTNENTHGLIRQYLLKKTSMARHWQDRCDSVAASLNARPRKRHHFRTPNELFDSLCD